MVENKSSVEVTPEMIEAGKRAYFEAMHQIDGYESVPTEGQMTLLVSCIFREMSALIPLSRR